MYRILLPGGATYFNNTNGYADAGQHIYDIAIKMNDHGDWFPIVNFKFKNCSLHNSIL